MATKPSRCANGKGSIVNHYEEDDKLESGLKLWADVGVEVGRSVDKVAEKTDQLAKALQDETPIYRTFVGAGSFVTGTPLYLDLGAPDVGTFWEVRGWTVGGTNYYVTATGNSGLYISTNAVDYANNLGNVVDFSLTLPYSNRYSSEPIVVKAGESVVVGIQGATNAQVYYSNVRVLVWRDDAGQGAATWAV
jgi:hypothetical protein